MSLLPTTSRVLPALRMLSLAVALAVLAGCGQKGDLYRPGKSQKLAVISETSSQS